MTDQDSEDDARLDRLANSLEVVRQDAALARLASSERTVAGLERIETELQRLSAGIETLRRDGERQRMTAAQLESAATRGEAALQGLYAAVEVLSRLHREQTEMIVRSSLRVPPPPPPPRSWLGAKLAALFLVVVLLGGGGAAWIVLDHGPASRPNEVTATGRTAPDEAERRAEISAPPVADAAPAPQSVATPSPAAVAVSDPPPPATADVSGPSATSVLDQPPPAVVPPSAGSVPVAGETVAGVAAPVDAAEPTPAAAVEQAPILAAPDTAPAQPSQPPGAMPHLVLRATADAWVQVRKKGGAVLLRRVMKAGESWTVPPDSDLLLDSGNAGGIEIDLDGSPLKPVGGKGGVVRDILLGPGMVGLGQVRAAH
jgi:cytoskeleton protein RodZ